MDSIATDRELKEHGVSVMHYMPDGDGVYIKKTLIPAGKTLPMHTHTFTHKSVLAKGSAMVSFDDKQVFMQAPCVITMKYGVRHAVAALTDVVWLCIHASEETDSEKIDMTLSK